MVARFIVAVALASAALLAPGAIGPAPALAQDFSITNPEQPTDGGRRDVMRQLQAYWDLHAYYPRHASQIEEAGTVKLHLVIRTDGNIFRADVVGSSGSSSLDTAAASTFRQGFVRPFKAGMPEAEIDVSLHYVLARRGGQLVGARAGPGASVGPFTITNDPVKSPILETMLQRTCTGTVVKQGIRNHPLYGVRYGAEAIFFRKPDGTPWVKFYEGGFPVMAPVKEVGKLVLWSGRVEYIGGGNSRFTHYTVWPDGENNLAGSLEIVYSTEAKNNQELNRGGTVDFLCAAEVVPAIAWNAWAVTPGQPPAGDPP